jgi:hypothetical protein
MSIEDRLKVVQLAEIECEMHAGKARSSWKAFKTNFRDAATPWRIVTVGAISGFLMGRSGGGAGGGDSVGAKLFGTIAQALITTLGAGATAGMAATEAADAAASATTGAVEAATTPAETQIAEAKQDKKTEPAAS